jgi:phosphate transport system permease protein
MITIRNRILKERGAIVFCSFGAIFAVGMLFLIIGEIFIGAIPSLSLHFILTDESKNGLGHGIANAIVGTILISLFSTILATPLALGTAIYLKRYARENRLTQFIRFMIEVLSGTPSIVVGMFGLIVLVVYLQKFTGGFSLIAGMICLAILIVPVIERAIESSIETVNSELEEGSYALGATKWQTIYMVTIPTVMSGILTSLILGFGRAAEESSVLVLTAGYSQWLSRIGIDPNSKFFFGFQIHPFNDPTATLPYAVYNAYENTNVIPMSNAYAIAFILIIFVLTVNIIAKVIGTHAIARSQGKSSAPSWMSYMMRKQSLTTLTAIEKPIPGLAESISQHGLVAKEASDPHPEITDMLAPAPQLKKIDKEPPQNSPVRPFLRTLFPFAIPAVILLLIAFLATIPPLHHALGTASPFLAGVFAIGLSLIIVVAGLAFALLFAKKGGAFRKKTRRTGFAGVIAGVCLVCIAGIICASSAAGVFSTGAGPAPAAAGDRNAQLAALLAAGDPGSGGSEVQVQEPAAQAPASPAPVQGNSTTVSVPLKDALSVGESYTWGNAQHTCRATIYDYKVLPFYFWWWIDYNRFVLQAPAAGDSYLVIFIRIENTGTQSAIVPPADVFNVSYRGNSYGRLPYMNTSLLSDFQQNSLGLASSSTLQEQYYQWIREIGQNKRDYAYLTGENLFGNNNSTASNDTVFINTTATTTNSTAGYNGAYLKPGPSQAIDGYLIYEVPYEATTHLNETYVDVSFNSLSTGRWKLGY